MLQGGVFFFLRIVNICSSSSFLIQEILEIFRMHMFLVLNGVARNLVSVMSGYCLVSLSWFHEDFGN